MLKLIGLCLIFISCSGIGLCLYRYTVYCVNYTDGLIDALKALKRELEFSEEYIGEALIKVSEFGGEAGTLLKKCGEELENYCEFIDVEKATTKVKDICRFFLGQVGKNNIENELKLIDNTVDKLFSVKKEQEEYSKKTGKLWAKSGVLIGLVLVVVLA